MASSVFSLLFELKKGGREETKICRPAESASGTQYEIQLVFTTICEIRGDLTGTELDEYDSFHIYYASSDRPQQNLPT